MSEELLNIFYPLSELEANILAGKEEPPDARRYDDLVLRRERFLRSGKLIAIALNYRFCTAQLHSHDFIEMAYMLHGSVTHEIEGRTVALTEGDLLIMNRNVHHSVGFAGREDIMINFIVLPEFFGRAMELAQLEDSPMHRFFLSCILDDDNTPDYLLFNIREILPLRHLVENLIWSVKNDVPYKQTTNQLTMALLLRLLQYHAGSVRSDEPGYGLIWEVQRYIDKNYRDGSLEDAAAQLQYEIPVRQQDQYRFGCILADSVDKYSDPFFVDILSAMELTCKGNNSMISIVKSYRELAVPQILQEFISADLDGVFLMEHVPEETMAILEAHIPHIIMIDKDVIFF